jgi:pilus assembly protein Flp/PilA
VPPAQPLLEEASRSMNKPAFAKNFVTLLRDDRGATLVEYGIMIALIAAVCVILVGSLGKRASNAFSSINTSI